MERNMNRISEKRTLLLIYITILLVLFSCSENNNPIVYNTQGKTALIIVVENNDGLLSSANDAVYQFYRTQLLSIFSELFQISEAELWNKSINEIIETYGEDWQLNEIKKHAIGRYDTIIAFQDETANLSNLKRSLLELSQNMFTIDMVFCLHGSPKVFVLNNHEYCDINEFAGFIKNQQIKLRILYQTCCDAGQAIDKWTSSGLYAVNGAVGTNYITLFSPGYFMEEWVNGKNFEEAVKNSFNRDIEKIRSYNDRVPVNTYILTESNIKNSMSVFGGRDKRIRHINIP